MSELKDIVNVQITRDTGQLTRAGFGTALLLVAGFTDVAEAVVKSYASAAEVLADGFGTDSAAYRGAAAYFSQAVRPQRLLIGDYDSSDPLASLAAVDAVNPDWYALFISDANIISNSRTLDSRILLLAEAIEATERIFVIPAFGAATITDPDPTDTTSLAKALKSEGYTRTASVWSGDNIITAESIENFVDNPDFTDGDGWAIASPGGNDFGALNIADGEMTITNVGEPFAVALGDNSIAEIGAYVLEFDIVSADAAVTSVSAGIAVLVGGSSETHVPVLSVASPAENLGRHSGRFDVLALEPDPFIVVPSGQGAPPGGAIEGSDLALMAIQANVPSAAGQETVIDNVSIRRLDSSSVNYSVTAPAAWLGRMLPTDPGSVTWAHKRITGLTPANLTATQRANLFAKNANLYSRVSGIRAVRFGTMASGEYVDIIRGIDWLTQRMREDVFRALARAGKVPYTDAGLSTIENVVRARLRGAQDIGLIAPDTTAQPGFSLTVVPGTSADRAERRSRIDFSARLAGAIHIAQITGAVAP